MLQNQSISENAINEFGSVIIDIVLESGNIIKIGEKPRIVNLGEKNRRVKISENSRKTIFIKQR